jgi:hypothetical protein
MLHRTIVCFLGAGLMAGAVFAAEPTGHDRGFWKRSHALVQALGQRQGT